MRTLSMLLLVVAAFLVVRWFVPSAEVAAEDPPASEPAEVRFLEPPPAPTPVHAATAAEAPSPEPAPPAWPKSLLNPAEAGSDDEVRLAAALAHGTPAQVQEASARLDANRARLLESFAWELAGERQMALSLSEKIARDSVASAERLLFEAALTGRRESPAPGTGPVALGMEMALLAREARTALAGGQHPEAARAFSDLLVREFGAPWPPDRRALTEWTEGLDQAQREHRWSPRGDWPASEVKVASGDSLIAIRLRFLGERPGALLCTGMIERANRLRGHLQPGQVLRIPTDPVRVLVDLDARWALYFLGDEVAAAWPVGIGRPGEETPVGDYTIRNKLENPPWMKEGQEPIPFGDPRNPLGTRWMGWSREGGRTSYGFHGTWEPESIGQAASDGCVRLLNEDAEELFQILPEGTPVRVQG
ncbi:MAG TPA: L,D-transpeptidase family protein [Planctomycetota bacterium]